MLQGLLIPEEFLQLYKLETAISICDGTSFFGLIGVDSDELADDFEIYLQAKIDDLVIFEPKTESILSELKECKSKDTFMLINASEKKDGEFIKNSLFFRDFISDYNLKIILIVKKEHYKSIIKNAIDLYNISTFSYLFSTYKVDIVKDIDTTDLDKMLKEYQEKKSTLSKKQKVAYLAEIARLNEKYGEIKDALKYYNQALKIAQKMKLQETIILIYFDMSNLYRKINQYKIAEKYLLFCKQFYEDKHNIKQYKATLDLMILLYLEINNYDEALSQADELYKLAMDERDKSLELNSLKSYLTIYHRQGNKDKIAKYLKKVYTLANELNNTDKLASVYQMQAIDYVENRKFRDALKNLNKALEIYRGSNQFYMINNMYLFIAKIYYQLNSYDKSLVYLKWCYKYFIDNDVSDGIMHSLILFSNIEESKSNYKSALEYSFKALKLSNSLTDKFGVFLSISQIYNSQMKYNDALKFIDKASKLSSNTVELYARYSDTYKNMGVLDKAYVYYQKALDLVDTLAEETYVGELYGEILFQDNKLDEALACFQNVLKVARKIDDFDRILSVEENLGFLYKKMGNIAMSRRFFMEVITKLKAIGANDKRIEKLTNEVTL